MCEEVSLRGEGFNPRARVGRDRLTRDARVVQLREVSIRAPAWGATETSQAGIPTARTFQSARPRGARRNYLELAPGDLLFQSARPRGARRGMSLAAACLAAGFNPRARVGRDCYLLVIF